MIFSNFNDVADTHEKKMVLRLADAGINSVLPKNFIHKHVKMSNGSLVIKNNSFDIKNKRIFVIGAGKMVNEMALELEKIIGHASITYGIVISNHIREMPKKIIVHEATHPIPSAKSVSGAKKIVAIKNGFKLNKDDFIISLISGGGSSLLCLPKEGISLQEEKNIIMELIRCGANVHEITIIKKKISKVKGGKLAQYFYPTPIISLVVSDVVGDDLEVIASGPLTMDDSDPEEALRIIKKYKIAEKIPQKVLEIIKGDHGNAGLDFSHVSQFLLASNSTALKAITKEAKKEDLDVVTEEGIQGEAELVAKKICGFIGKGGFNKSTLFVYGGETTVSLGEKHGMGGRNQEFIAASLKYFNCNNFTDWNFCITSIATDGVDFIEESCGGIIDKSSFIKLKNSALDLDKYLKNHSSYTLLKEINSSLSTGGLTGTNVGDIIMFLFMRK